MEADLTSVAETTLKLRHDEVKSKDIRGFTGEGMLCSYEELCLSVRSDGIIELPEDAPVGKKYVDWSSLSDPIFEIGLTPNRGDCASVLGKRTFYYRFGKFKRK